jgi:hypothetical protein
MSPVPAVGAHQALHPVFFNHSIGTDIDTRRWNRLCDPSELQALDAVETNIFASTKLLTWHPSIVQSTITAPMKRQY